MKLDTLSLLVAASLLGGCALVYSWDDYQLAGGGSGGAASTSVNSGGGGSASSSSSSTSSSSTSSSSSGAASCAATEICAPSPPAGWSGPIVLELGATKPACTAAGFTTAVPQVAGGTTYDASGGCTACSCGAPAGGACPPDGAVTTYGSAGCGAGATAATVPGAMCLGVIAGSIQLTPTAAIGVSCSSSATQLTKAAAFTQWAQGCSPDSPKACAGGVCVEPGEKLCIHAAGTQTCPTDYPHATVVYESITDGRSCSACTCGAVGSVCKPTVGLFAACIDQLATLTADGSCFDLPAGGNALQVMATGTPTGGHCAVTGGGQLSGTVDLGAATTVCCQN